MPDPVPIGRRSDRQTRRKSPGLPTTSLALRHRDQSRADAQAGAASVLVVIPCLNEEAHLPALLNRLIRENPKAMIAVADGGSTDSSRRIVSDYAAGHPRLFLVDNPARIQSAGINLAVARFGEQAQWLVRIDAHCVYPRGYIDGLLACARRIGAQSVVVPMVSEGSGCFQRAAAAAQNSKLGTGGSPHRHVGHGRVVDHGHHALMDIALFRRVGGYDERMSHNEDAELDTRIRKAGGRIWLEPSLALTYFPRDRAATLFRQYWNYGRGRAKTRALHGQPMGLRQVLPLAVPAASLLLLFLPWFPFAWLPLIAWIALCVVAGIALRGADRSRCAKFAGVPAMIMHFAWGWGFLRQTLFGPHLTPRQGSTQVPAARNPRERSTGAKTRGPGLTM